ncbi:MAG: FAD-dependent oxidoreductase [Gammaproteobacteria bacterium]|nr:FAD-dependent oxidoreductase [Gammaproteobacteria bacterium]
MSNINRRKFIQLTGGTMAAAGVMSMPYVSGASGKSVVIVGGGPGGATAAHYLLKADPSIKVTLIEANANYHTCFMSNEVLSGFRSMESIMVTFDGLRKMGVNVVTDTATAVDAEKRTVKTASGKSIGYDRLILSPGIDFKYGAGYTAETAKVIPHAWKAGPQTALLRKQLVAMKDGGTVLIVAPPNPFRCPPGPYERASLIANYLKKHKPKSKILIVDPKEKFSKMGLFTGAWKRFYGYGTDNSMINWMPASQVGAVTSVDAKGMTVNTEFESFKADVINYIPAQKAGKVAFAAGVNDASGWCPVNKKTFESTQIPGIHVLGDASIATAMPKSGYSASSQGKVVAAAVADLLNGRDPGDPSFLNTCYSKAADDYAFSVSAVYNYNSEKNLIAKVAGGLSPSDASDDYRKREVGYAHSWYKNIRADIWG